MHKTVAWQYLLHCPTQLFTDDAGRFPRVQQLLIAENHGQFGRMLLVIRWNCFPTRHFCCPLLLP